MKKEITCIECPKGCRLNVSSDADGAFKVEGNLCPKGEKYAFDEINNPVRVLTTVILAKGLAEQMVPVRTDKAIPKDKLFEAMEQIKAIRLRKAVNCGEIIAEDFLDIKNTNLIATRTVKKSQNIPT